MPDWRQTEFRHPHAFQHSKADHEFSEAELEPKTNIEITRQIHALTTEHRRLTDERGR